MDDALNSFIEQDPCDYPDDKYRYHCTYNLCVKGRGERKREREKETDRPTYMQEGGRE